MSLPCSEYPAGLRRNQLLANLRAGGLEHLYVMGNHATPRHVDWVAGSGLFQSLWFDLEHFDLSTDLLATLNLVARAHSVTTIARLNVTDYQTAIRTLETGVGGLMGAMVDTPQQAASIVEWSKFRNPNPAPDEATGLRGWNGGGIDGRYGTVPPLDYVAHQNRETAILCQIETEEGVANAAAIAAVPGVDGLFFGPGDYAHRLGKPGQIGDPLVFAAMEKIANACRSTGKFWGTLGIGREGYQRVRSLGAQLICPGGDVRVLNLGLKELARTFLED